tara:strand:- start:406 stop:873 length:468 start_codon:yes stop_codon:yes gene_type:complete
MKRGKIYLSGDHAGFNLKKKVLSYLEKRGYSIEDFGPNKYNSKDDYPDFVVPMAKKVAKDKNSRGIVIAGSGIGEVIASNKIKGIRSVLFHGKANKKFLETSRIHDNTNVLCLGSRFVNEGESKKGINIWLKTEFKGEIRHKRRLKKIERYTNIC